MQTILRRTIQARNQAVKKSQKKEWRKIQEEKHEARSQEVARKRYLKADLLSEKQRRHEDWVLGPLAPQRVAGKNGGGYGAVHPTFFNLPNVIESERVKYFNFAVKDRVVMLHGRDKGKIGKIQAVDKEKQTVTVAELNMADMEVTDAEQELHQLDSPLLSRSIPVSIDDVRLVIPLKDKLTGQVKDAVVEHLRGGEPLVKRRHGVPTPEHTRYVAGPENITIPWPKAPEPRFPEAPCDTAVSDMGDQTYSPSITTLPHPTSVIDELRNRYARERTRHSPEYVRQKLQEDAKAQWQSRRKMVLPRQELWETRAAAKAVKGIPVIEERTLEIIQAVQAEQSRVSPVQTEKSAA